MINIDEIVRIALPWDFKVTVGGIAYETRRPVIGELMLLQQSGSMLKPEGRAQLAALFVGEKPDIEKWDDEMLLAFVMAYMAYFTRRTEKKAQAIAEGVQHAVALLPPI